MKIVSRVDCCCPTDPLGKPGKIGVLRGGQVAEVSTCYPTEAEQIPQIHFAPERRPQQSEEPAKRGEWKKSGAKRPSARALTACRGTTVTASGARFYSTLESGFAAAGGRPRESTASAVF